MKCFRVVMVMGFVIAVLMIVTGCQNATHEPTTVSATGTVRYIELPVRSYGIVGNDGHNYEPINLPAEFQEDGLPVAFTARILDDYASIFMWGQIIEIISIEMIVL